MKMFYIWNVLYFKCSWKCFIFDRSLEDWWKNLVKEFDCAPGWGMPTWTSTDNLGWGGFESMWRRKKPRERLRERERERDEIWMEATFQGKMSIPIPCLCCGVLLDTKAISGVLHEIFTYSWPVSRNMSVASCSPCWAPMSSQRTRGVSQFKWHALFSLSGKDPSYWNGSS